MTGTISSVSGTSYDLRSDVQIGSIIDKSADISNRGINTTYCLTGPTGSRLAARFTFIFTTKLCMFSVCLIVCILCILTCLKHSMGKYVTLYDISAIYLIVFVSS